MKFNINDTVSVKLTDYGISLLEQATTELETVTGSKFLHKQYQTNKWTKFQLWDLMNRFGSHLFNGANPLPFETTIRIPKPHPQIHSDKPTQ